MKLIELVIDETNPDDGVELISLVKQPAIESYWVALNASMRKQKFAEISAERRVVMGAAMIPDLPIFRKHGDEEFHVYFSRDTIRKCMEMFLKHARHTKSNYEHEDEVRGVAVIESWIKEDSDKDKSTLYGLDVPVGSWMVTMKIDNDVIWEQYVKTGEVQGFSIEGQFHDKLQMKSHVGIIEALESELRKLVGKDGVQ